MRRFAAIALVLSALSGCATLTNFKTEGMKKASFDLECPEDKLSVKENTKTEVTVSGCGKKATFTDQGGGAWTATSVKSE